MGTELLMMSEMKISDEFHEALPWSGSIYIQCNCGRVHYVDKESADFDPGELEDIRKKAIDRPELYVRDTEYDFISWTRLFGMPIVLDCPCGYLEQIEKSLWQDRKTIIQYYKARKKKINAAVAELNKEMEGLD